MSSTSKQTRRQRTIQINKRLREKYPEATTALNWKNPYELLVATILSAQCTDKTVNQVTQQLFAKYPTVEDLAAADREELQQDIYSTGFYRRKAKSIQQMAQKVVAEFNGEIPDNMEEMLTLPGAARKTANVVLGTAFEKPTGIVVDTHVKRLAARMGLTTKFNPKKIEQDLTELLPRDQWIQFGHIMIWHGRDTCDAKKPMCAQCTLADICPKIGVE